MNGTISQVTTLAREERATTCRKPLEQYAERLRAELRLVERELFHNATPASCCEAHQR